MASVKQERAPALDLPQCNLLKGNDPGVVTVTTGGWSRRGCARGPMVIWSRSNRSIAMATAYLVQGFVQKGNKLVADTVKPCKTEASAISTAERLGPSRAGVVAFSQEVDIETDTYDEPRVLLRIGKLPPGLFE